MPLNLGGDHTRSFDTEYLKLNELNKNLRILAKNMCCLADNSPSLSLNKFYTIDNKQVAFGNGVPTLTPTQDGQLYVDLYHNNIYTSSGGVWAI